MRTWQLACPVCNFAMNGIVIVGPARGKVDAIPRNVDIIWSIYGVALILSYMRALILDIIWSTVGVDLLLFYSRE